MAQESADIYDVVCVGAGPAGLTASYLLTKNDKKVLVLEADQDYVGGISKTVSYKGYHFDIGGHRFFSKSQAVEDLWTELLPDDMLVRPRSSRILYDRKFYSYPLKAFEALFNLGVMRAVLCVLSYMKSRAFPHKDPKNFQDWVTNQFGSKLFNIFFKTYTEKVWGMSCKDISSDWAAQRIKGLSLWSAIWNAIWQKKQTGPREGVIKTLINEFRYPRKGPGMMWDAAAAKTIEQGGEVKMGARGTSYVFDESSKTWTISYELADGSTETVQTKHMISTIPMRELVNSVEPKLDSKVIKAANSLEYRDFLTIALIVEDHEQFSDNWIYIHDPSVKVGRIQNFKSWSPEMVPDAKMNCYGLEYFCFEGDGLWEMSDADLIELAKKEMEQLGLCKIDLVKDGCVVRQKKAYPVYDGQYATHVQTIRDGLTSSFEGLHLIGRNGMHKYNNQDHAMMSAMLTAENIIADKPIYDVWLVNSDAEYHEEGAEGNEESSGMLRSVPRKVASEAG